jgi:hypothetical protein
MKRTWTIIGVRDVAASFKWYQSLFGQPETLPAHDYRGPLERLVALLALAPLCSPRRFAGEQAHHRFDCLSILDKIDA